MLIALYFMACADLHCCTVNPQLLWWGTEETLVELSTWHESAGNSEGNRVGTFCATIVGVEYGPGEMPAKIGLYGGQYSIHFCPGEYLSVVCD